MEQPQIECAVDAVPGETYTNSDVLGGKTTDGAWQDEGTAGEESEATDTAGEESEATDTAGEESEATDTSGEESEATDTAGEERERTDTNGEEVEILDITREDGNMTYFFNSQLKICHNHQLL